LSGYWNRTFFPVIFISQHSSYLFIFVCRKTKTFIAQPQTANSTAREQNQQLALDPLRIPHSNAFLDVTGDMTAGILFIYKYMNV
jgi:hypothetical protein